MKLFLFFFFLLFSFSNAQFSSAWYNTDNGLPQNSVKDIIKDKFGFIWLATDNGLVKYDGLNFITFENLPISNLHFENFLGNIENDTIVIYNNYEKEKVLIQTRFPKVFDKKNNIYKQLSKKNGVFNQRISRNLIHQNKYYDFIQYFIKTKLGTYTFSKDQILYKEKGNSKKISIPFNNQNLHNVFLKDDVLYVRDPQKRKTYIISRGNLEVSEKPTLLNDPNTIIYWHQTTGQVLLINKACIYIFFKKNNQSSLKFLVQNKDINRYPISAIYYDQDFNKLYLGTTNNGLNVIDLNQFYIARDHSDFVDNIFYASLPFGKNSIITPDGVEFRKDGVYRKYPFGDHANDQLLYDNNKNILLGDVAYIVRVNKNSNYQKQDSLYVNLEFGKILQDKNLYGYTTSDFDKNNYLFILKNDKFNHPDYGYKFKGIINTFIKYDQNNLLIGCDNGLYLVPLNDIRKQKIFPGIYVKKIIRTKDGSVWITTNKNGFYLFRDQKLIKMPTDVDNYLESAHYILEDQYGYFWISSNNGLFKVPQKQLIQYADNKSSSVFYYRFSKHDGFLTNEFNNSAAQVLENKEFVFPSMNGFIFFNPSVIRSYYPKSNRIYIEKAKIDDSETVYFNGTLTLKNNYKQAEVFVEIPYYSNHDNLRVEARLKNTKYSDWTVLKNGRYFIKGIYPGEYELEFRVLVSPEGKFFYKTITVNIEAQFYQTLAFKIAMIIVLILLILWVIRSRTNLLKTRNRSLRKKVFEKESRLKKTSEDLKIIKETLEGETEYQKKIIETISHDIATPIKHLSNLSKNLYELDDLQQQKKYLDSIYRSSKELYKFTLNLKEYSSLYRENKIYEEKKYPIFELIEIKRILFQELALLNNTVIYNKVEQNIMTDINRNIILLIVHNLLDNAVKNTQFGHITIEGYVENELTKIKISDSGIGMSQEQIDYYMDLFKNFKQEELFLKKYGLGLHMVLHFIKKIGADISFSKNHPKGTITLIILK